MFLVIRMDQKEHCVENRFEALGNTVKNPTHKLESFSCPDGVSSITLECSEVTSLCPVTGQPDFATVKIYYMPKDLCIESKSLKLYLWQFRNQGIFCEELAARIREDIIDAVDPRIVDVEVLFAKRGGISIRAQSSDM